MDKAVIPEGFVILLPKIKAIVCSSFCVHISQTKETKHYIAVDNFSTVFEIGKSPLDALLEYMKALIDEILWLEKRRCDFQDELTHMHKYVKIVEGIL